jgi:hypothetical protein
MVKRCNDNIRGYEDATVCDEWKNYYNFEKWYMEHVYATKQWRLELDKDLFGNGYKVYSPETCCLIPKSFNLLLASCTSRNQFLPGVSMTKSGTYTTTVTIGLKSQTKVFKTEEECFFFYKLHKENAIKCKAEASRPILPQMVYDALMKYEVKPIRGTYHESMRRSKPVVYYSSDCRGE